MTSVRDTALNVVLTAADKQIPNYKVAGGLAAAEALIWTIDLFGWESTSSFLQALCVLTAAGMAVNQYGVSNSIQAAQNFGTTLFKTASSYGKSAEPKEVEKTVKKSM
jgi:hypothetical protein